MTETNVVLETIHAAAILFALIHFLAGLILFKDMLRINGAVKTKNSPFFIGVAFMYLLFLLTVLIVFLLA